jgi:hypothetical protein
MYKILIFTFVIRVFIYPMLIRGGKHSSILITLTALIFCCVNTYSIAEEMLVYHVYSKTDWLSLHFIFG